MSEEKGGQSADTILMCIFGDDRFYSNFVANGPIEIESALVHVLPWCR